MTDTPPIVLASSSPRRSTLLHDAGFPHRVVPPAIDDASLERGEVSPSQWIVALAHLKARSVIDTLPPAPASIVLAADTLVVCDDRIFGQPRDAEDAARTIRALRDRTHTVTTAVAYDPGDGLRWLTDSASVTIGRLTDADIDAYAASDAWQGKAGAYNLTERIDAGWPISFVGDPTTVVGLPMRKLTPRLEHALWQRNTRPGPDSPPA